MRQALPEILALAVVVTVGVVGLVRRGPRAREHRPLLASAERLHDVATSSPSN